MIDYKELVNKVKDTISNYQNRQFSYVERTKWIDNLETFPASNVNRFTVFVESKTENEESSCINSYILNLNVQFVLEGTNDNYLSVLGYCEEAVKLLRDVSYSAFKIIKADPYFELTLSNNFVIVNFNGLQFITD